VKARHAEAEALTGGTKTLTVKAQASTVATTAMSQRLLKFEAAAGE
jgi:hypothetical protein